MNILVTGAEGFIGSNLVEYLLNKKFNVTGLVKYNFKHSVGLLETIDVPNHKKFKIVHGDINDNYFISDFINEFDIIINLAALIAIPYSYKAPESYIETNLKGTMNILNNSKNSKKIKKIIICSTSEVYGSAQKIPIDEKHPINPQSPYAASKASADFIAQSYFRSFNTPVVIARPFNNFGPRQSLRAVIPSIINQLLKGKDLLIGKTDSIRDFLFVSDTSAAFEKLIMADKKLNGEIFNFCTGKGYKIIEVINFISEILDKKPKIIIKNNRLRPEKSEVDRLIGSYMKSKNLINWKPNYITKKHFIIALQKTISWYENNNFYNFEDNIL